LQKGKFIRIHFGGSGKLAGADIETCNYDFIIEDQRDIFEIAILNAYAFFKSRFA